jgi:hypothetical protein
MAAGDVILASDFRQGVIAQATRTTSTAATVTTEVGVLRMDNIQIYNGLAYEISVSPLALKGSVVGDIIESRIRVNTAGTATTSSTQITVLSRTYADAAASPDKASSSIWYYPTADSSTFSVLLTLSRNTAGGASTGVQMLGSSTDPIQLVVKCVGTAPADSGVSL